MSLIVAQSLNFNGIAPVYTPAASDGNGDTFRNDGYSILTVKNDNTAATVVTIKSAQLCNQGFSHDITVNVAASSTEIIGPFPTARFNNGSGLVTVSCSPATSVSLGLIKVN